MKKLHVLILLFLFSKFSSLVAQDTLTVHAVKLTQDGNIYRVDGSIVSANIFKQYQDEIKDFEAKSNGKTLWVRRLDKNNKLIEQGLFCNGMTSIGNLLKDKSKGQIYYKRLCSGLRMAYCGQTPTGQKATEEIYDYSSGSHIYGTYLDGQKHGQFLHYDKDGTVIGVEAYDKGVLLKRKGRTYVVNPDGTFSYITDVAVKK
jgi:antitoxin component YwqK of YwqJK toxin-antitoxin module